jgi:hypothetical protein
MAEVDQIGSNESIKSACVHQITRKDDVLNTKVDERSSKQNAHSASVDQIGRVQRQPAMNITPA